MFVYFTHYIQWFPVSSLPEEVSQNFGSDRMSTHVGCGAASPSWPTPKHECSSMTDQQVAGEPGLCCVSVHVEGCREQQEVFCQHILASFSSILLLSTRIYDSLHLYRIIADKRFKPNTVTSSWHQWQPRHTTFSQNVYTDSCKHEQKASPDTSSCSWLQMQSQEKVTYSRWTIDTLRVRSLHKNTINRSLTFSVTEDDVPESIIVTYLCNDISCKICPSL